MNIYYSHSKLLRGSTQEEADIELLEKLGFKVDNPYSPMYSDFWETEGFEFGKTLIEKNDAFAFRALPDGKIASGVAKELKTAMDMGKPILELPFSLTSRSMSVEETVEWFKEVGHQKARRKAG